ncbi:hypothetical protein QL285_047227 [Trifolium repens]|nr:hypothetical protein QL285_047227 [Trifolium repens]
MATSSDSNRFYFETRPVTSPPILYDSVRDSPYGSDSDSEIEKDFAPPSKKLKGPLSGKGHSTDPFPKDEYDKALARLQDLITNVASFTNREIFDIWRAMWQITYISKEEEDARFRIFEKSIIDEPRNQEEGHRTLTFFADRTNKEFKRIYHRRGFRFNKFVFKSLIGEQMASLAENSQE